MKKYLLIAFLCIFISALSHAQLTGVKNIPVDYSTIALAISDLNSQGVGPGGVLFTIDSLYTETFTSPTAGKITATGTLSNPITFQKKGSGANPLITAGVGTTTTLDGIIVIAGGDYITFDGIDLKENSANTTATTQMEWGYAILKASATDGAQNITIRNCTVTLNKANTATVGIYANNHLTSALTALTVTSTSGANSNLKIYNNTINNCYSGISVTGFSDVVANAFAFYDQNNEIGKDGANTIGSFGGSTVASYGIYTKYQNNLKVANNTINGSVTGTGSCSGIQLDASSNASLELYGNTVKIAYAGTSGTFNGIFDNMGTTATNNLVDIHDNTVTQCTMPLATTGSCNYINIQHAGVPFSFHGNSVTSNTYGSTSTTSLGQIAYIYLFGNPATLSTVDVYSNEVSNNTRPQITAGSAVTYLYYMGLKGSVQNTYNNAAINNTFTSTGQTHGYYVANASATKNIYGNTLNGLTSGGISYGIYVASGSNANIYRNKIQNITTYLNTTASATLVAGIYIGNGTSLLSVNVYNNMISEIFAPSGTYAKSVGGIVLFNSAATTDIIGIYDNTVYLTGTGAAGFGSSAFYVHSNSAPTSNPNFDLRGNIFVNNCTPGTGGLVVAFRTNSTDNSKYSSLSNNNDFWAGTPDASHLILNDGTNSFQTLASFKAWVYPNETVSVTENPSFVNVVTSPFDLHLNPAVATQCESAGQVISTPVSITTDFDGNGRFPNSGYPVGTGTPFNPDLGADEIGGLQNDITGPWIQYTPLGNAPNGSARVLTATIQDASGMPTSGTGLPRLYWRINSGSWNSAQAVFVSGNSYNFTFGAGSNFNDVVSYYIVAQDLVSTSNVGSSPSPGATGYTSNPPACSTPPNAPSTYTNLGAITGTFHVGVGKTYTTITAAINDLNFKTRTGPVTFLLDDATYPSETIPITITSSAGASAVNTVTIKPNAANTVLISGINTHAVGSDVEGIFLIKGAQYITIDGSNTGTLSLTENQAMTIENTDYSGNTSVLAFSNSPGAGTSHIKIQNCVIQAVTSLVWATSVVTFSNTNGGYDNIILNNNIIRQGKFGMTIYGTATSPANNIQVTNNVIGSADDSKSITWRGVDAQYCNNLLVQGNEIMGQPSGNQQFSMVGINFDHCTNSKINKNIVHDWILNDISVFSVGISYFDLSSSHGEITNNLVYNVAAYGSNLSPTQAGARGMDIERTSDLLIANNTVRLNGAYLGDGDGSGVNPGTTSSCIYFASVASGVDFRNNILNNSMTRLPGASSPYTNTYAIACGGGNNPFTYCDNNDYFGDGVNPYVGYANSVTMQFLNDWKLWTAKDWSSINDDPRLTSTTNLLPLTGSPVIGTAVHLTSVPDDILGVTRNAFAPTMGAYELPVYPVTFNLDMSTAAGFTPGTDLVYIAGNFPGASSWNQPGTNPNLLMSQVGTTLTYTLTLYLPVRAYEYKYFKNAGWSGGEYAGGTNRSATITTTTIVNDTWGGLINWANLQWPGTGSINFGGSYDVYAQVYIPNGITASSGATYGLQAWIGYSTTNTDPGTWTDWVPASFSGQAYDNDEFKADLGSAITGSGTYYYASRFQYGNNPYVYGGFNGGYWNGTSNISGVLNIAAPPTKTLNVKLFLEGLYNTSTSLMNQAQSISGPQFGSGIADQVTVELHNAVAPYGVAYSSNNVNLLTTGNLSVNSVPGALSGSFYIVIKHRNSIETWSAAPIVIGMTSPVSYDFSSSSAQAFGNNLKLMGTIYAIYAGDANLDGVVDGSDMAAIDNASTSILIGYQTEDVNGDGVVDGSDMAIIDNNATSIVQVMKP
ncbi:MAG: hypothetical protein HXX13_10045 [Bacteroidetes bacterium]|nr:hypothetical protein [Bacteroidota bacterium]